MSKTESQAYWERCFGSPEAHPFEAEMRAFAETRKQTY